MIGVSAEATRLEERLKAASPYGTSYEVLAAAAWEVAELDYLLANGFAHEVWWWARQGGD
jgi:hypothetical protein